MIYLWLGIQSLVFRACSRTKAMRLRVARVLCLVFVGSLPFSRYFFELLTKIFPIFCNDF